MDRKKIHTVAPMPSPPLPTWFPDYKPGDLVDERVHACFQTIYNNFGNLQLQEREVSKIINALLQANLLSTSTIRACAEVVSKSYEWASRTVAILTPELLKTLKDACDLYEEQLDVALRNAQTAHPMDEDIKRCLEHFKNLDKAEQDPIFRRNHQPKRHLSDWVVSLSQNESRSSACQDIWQVIEPLVFLLPRLGIYELPSDRTLSLAEGVATWFAACLWRRQNNLKNSLDRNPDRDPNCQISLDQLYGGDGEGSGTTLGEMVPSDSDQPSLPVVKRKQKKEKVEEQTDQENASGFRCWTDVQSLRPFQASSIQSEDLLQRDYQAVLGASRSLFLNEDPSEILQSIYVNKNPRCNYHELAKRLILQDVRHGDITTLADEFGINYQTLQSDLNRKFYPTISGLMLDTLGGQGQSLYQAIDDSEALEKINKKVKGNTKCNTRWLAPKILLGYFKCGTVSKKLEKVLEQDYPTLNLSGSFPYEDTPSIELFKGIQEVCQQQLSPSFSLTVWDLYQLWQNICFEAASQELKVEHGVKLSPAEIKHFWYSKAIKALGTLARDTNVWEMGDG